MSDKLPDSFIIPNTYDIPIHNQGNVGNCTSQAVTAMWEYKLSEILSEQVTINADDLWQKQLEYGTASEDEGDSIEGALKIANEYGMLFKTKSGKEGLFKPNTGIEFFE